MQSHTPKATPLQTMAARRDRALDIVPRALSIPTLDYRRASASSVKGDVEARVRCEFVEMRGFSPTVQQAARLFQINQDECVRLLAQLVKEGFLRQTPDGRFRLPS
jgi:hypothetical protein